MLKLIASDLDGTLLYPKHRIKLLSRKNKKFLNRYIASGNKVVLVSGRNLEIAKRISKRLGTPIDMVACNGAVTLCNKEIIGEQVMPKKQVMDLYLANISNPNISNWMFMTNKHNLIIVPNNMKLWLKVGFRIGMSLQFGFQGSFWFGKRFFLKALADPEVKFYKVMAICGLGKKATLEAKKQSEIFKEKYQNQFEIFWSKESIEFMNYGVNKAVALDHIINHYGIKDTEVGVVGDSGNDVPLFKCFPHSFVMVNAFDDIKQEATHTINGVYEIENYLQE